MWTLGGVRVFVQEFRDEQSQIIPRLQPINAGTILQIYGYDSVVNTISAIVVGDTDRSALLTMTTTQTDYELVSPEGSRGNFYVKKVASNRIPNICQTLRNDLDSDSPMYNVSIEIFPS
jgi:hypothetical protein